MFMHIKCKIIFGFAVILSQLQAGVLKQGGTITVEDVEGSDSVYKALSTRASEMMMPLYDQKREVVNEITAPFDAENEKLWEEYASVESNLSPLRCQREELLGLVNKLSRGLYSRVNQAVELAVETLEAELRVRREPIMEKWHQLDEKKTKEMNQRYTQPKRAGMRLDDIDEFDLGLRLSAIDRSIQELLATVDGDLQDQIEKKRDEVRNKVIAEIEEEKQRIYDEMKQIDLQIQLLQRNSQDVLNEIDVVKLRKKELIDQTMPGSLDLLRGIQRDLFLSLLSEGALI